MSWPAKIFLGAAMSWVASVALGLLFATMASGRFRLETLQLPGVIQVALVDSTAVALVVTPFAVWSLRTGVRNFFAYGTVLWIILALYDLLVIPRTGSYGPLGLFVLGVLGLVTMGLIPRQRSA